MKVIQNNILGLVSAVIVAQLIDYVWYSGMLPWQEQCERDLVLTVLKDVILAIASFVIYDTFYDGGYYGDVFEFTLMCTVMHFALDDKPMLTTTAMIALGHSFVILFSTIFVVHYVKSFMSPSKKEALEVEGRKEASKDLALTSPRQNA